MSRRRPVLVFAAGAAVVWGAGPLAVPGVAGAWAVPAARGAVRAGTVRAAGLWGRAIEVPGLRALNKQLSSQVSSLSCTSAGNCAAGGYYRDRDQNAQGFVASEKNGVWGRAIEVPGLGALNKGQNAQVFSVSCTSAGNCAAGGYYRHRALQGFAVVEKNGVWERAIEVPGLAALNKGGDAQVLSVSCTSAGNCAAVGYYRDQHRGSQGFVAGERNGSWWKAIKVPGLAALNQGRNAQVLWVSCASAGNCGAVGYYTDGDRHSQGFAVVEKNGRWGQAIKMPGLGALNQGGNAGVSEVSCPAAGSCAAVGSYTDGDRHSQGFAVVERNGRWGQAIEVPGLAALNARGAFADDVSCASAGNCAAGGAYTDSSGNEEGFVVTETHGRWGRAFEPPGLAALNTWGFAGVWAVSCASPGNCAAGGFYQFPYQTQFLTQGYVVSETNGRWGRAIEVPGLAALNNGGNAGVIAVSCASPGNCTAGGYDGDGEGIVVSEKNPTR